MIVMKFGGSSVGNADKVRRVVELVQAARGDRPVVVVSAHGKTTNRLIAAAECARREGVVDSSGIESFHVELCVALGLDPTPLAPLFGELAAMLHGIGLLKELTPRTLDQIMSFGERLSARILAAALTAAGLPAQAIDAFAAGLVTDGNFGNATPLPDIDAELGPAILAAAGVPVVTGFLGRDRKGNITTLGRSGSDFSAAIVGAAIEAREVQIWTDVDGVMTADPTVEPAAQSLRELSFTEASELAYYGAEVLHPNTLIPAIRKRIPVRVLNTLNPTDPGTLIVAEPIRGPRLAKSVVYKENVMLVNVASPRIMSAARLLAQAIDLLAAHGIGVHLAATSEATVSMVTDRHYSGEELEQALAELEKLGEVTIEGDKAILCVVGAELCGNSGAAGRILATLGAVGINARMISQSASELNVATLIENARIEPAVHALHRLVVE